MMLDTEGPVNREGIIIVEKPIIKAHKNSSVNLNTGDRKEKSDYGPCG